MRLTSKLRRNTKKVVDEATPPTTFDDVKEKFGEIADLLTGTTDETKGALGRKAAKAAKKSRKRVPELASDVIPGVVPRKKARRGSVWGFVWGAILAAILVYLFDKEHGEQRRRDLLTMLGVEDERAAQEL